MRNQKDVQILIFQRILCYNKVTDKKELKREGDLFCGRHFTQSCQTFHGLGEYIRKFTMLDMIFYPSLYKNLSIVDGQNMYTEFWKH